MRTPPVFTIAVLIALAVTALWWQLSERRARQLHHEVERLTATVDSLRASSNGSGGATSAGESAGAGERTIPASLLTPAQVQELRQRGLSEPVRDLTADLERHPELIPIQPVSGGTMRFYGSQSAVLSPKWMLAYFEDGHVAGHALMEYRVEPGGKIDWKVLTANQD
jgi:hypothetical protein